MGIISVIKQCTCVLFSVALRGSILYFVIVEMSMVNIMYQTSLKQFLELFDLSMARSQKSPITSKRINNIIDYLTLSVFQYTARGLYEIDKLLFTILMTLKIEMTAGRVRGEEFSVFIKGRCWSAQCLEDNTEFFSFFVPLSCLFVLFCLFCILFVKCLQHKSTCSLFLFYFIIMCVCMDKYLQGSRVFFFFLLVECLQISDGFFFFYYSSCSQNNSDFCSPSS